MTKGPVPGFIVLLYLLRLRRREAPGCEVRQCRDAVGQSIDRDSRTRWSQSRRSDPGPVPLPVKRQMSVL